MKMNLDGLRDLLGNGAETEAVALLVLEVEGFHEMRPKILKYYRESCLDLHVENTASNFELNYPQH